VCKLACN